MIPKPMELRQKKDAHQGFAFLQASIVMVHTVNKKTGTPPKFGEAPAFLLQRITGNRNVFPKTAERRRKKKAFRQRAHAFSCSFFSFG